MLIFSHLRHLYLLHSPHRKCSGFTLIELLVSVAIISIISTLVIVRFHAFDSTVTLKNAAYDIATAIRQAQIYSVSVVNIDGNEEGFRYPYGVTFSSRYDSVNKQYIFYRYEYSAEDKRPHYDIWSEDEDGESDSSVESLLVANLPANVYISDVCVVIGGEDDCVKRRLDITFRRPEYSALFWDHNDPNNNSEISSGKIKLKSTRDEDTTWVVEVSVLGQISTYKDENE
jgi:prepilin-type N-terminal cleavage/methylation domain-containing protein